MSVPAIHRDHGRRGAALLIVLAMLAGVLAAGLGPAAGTDGPVAGEPRPDKVDPELLEEIEEGATGGEIEALVVLRAERPLSALGDPAQVPAVLETTARTSQEPVVEAITDRGDEVLNTFWLKNMVLARLSPETVMALTALDVVEQVIPNFTVELPDSPEVAEEVSASDEGSTWGIAQIGADVVQDEFGAVGNGVRVAVLDTGVDIAHPDLAGRMVTDDPSDETYPGGWIEFDNTGQPVPSVPQDSSAHGTHVAGTAVGGDTSGTRIGVAPGADLMAAMVIPGGSGSFAQVIAGMQWAVAPHDADGNPAGEPAHVVNMSLAAVTLSQEMIEPTQNMYLAGVFPAFGIGNNCGGGSGSPANVYEAVAVGATDETDDVADFSCGETIHTEDWPDPPAEWPETYVVPDVSAPGVGVLSAVPGEEYDVLNGTSMATPHVAGVVALLLEARPDLTVDEALQVLIDTSTFDDRYGAERPNPRYGWGRIDAYRSYTEVAFDSGITGTLRDATTGEGVSAAAVTRLDVGRDVESDASGDYQLALPAGSYDLEVTRFGYETVQVDDVVVEDGQLTRLDLDLTWLPSGNISGRVTYEPTGSRVPGATVTVRGAEQDLSAVTTVNGSYTIEGVPAGSYEVVTSAPGFPSSAAAEATVTVGQTVRHVDLDLPRPLATERVSVGYDGNETEDQSLVPNLSADGRYLAFYSFASNIIPGDTNGAGDSFVLDRHTGDIELISVGPGGVQGNGPSLRPRISADGRVVTFSSTASNLVDGDTNEVGDIFVHDRETGQTERVSVASDGTEANGTSLAPWLSGDGRFVAYYSLATNLVEGDTNGAGDIFVHDRETGETERVSVASDGTESDGASFVPSLSEDGRYVSFDSVATNLVEGDTNGAGDIFVHDRETGKTERVSVAGDGSEGDLSSQAASMSADGRFVAFYSSATTLVEGDTNDTIDIFVHDRETGETERVSVASDGEQANAGSHAIPIVPLSADGRFVAFASGASNLVPGDNNGREDIFVHDRETGETERVSLAPDGSQGDQPSLAPALDASGALVVFHGRSGTLSEGDSNRETDVFLHDRGPLDPEAAFTVADLRISPPAARPGRLVNVTALVTNIGGAAGDYEAVLRVDGEVVDEQTVSLGADRQTRVRFQIRLEEPGTYEVSVGAVSGQLTVR